MNGLIGLFTTSLNAPALIIGTLEGELQISEGKLNATQYRRYARILQDVKDFCGECPVEATDHCEGCFLDKWRKK